MVLVDLGSGVGLAGLLEGRKELEPPFDAGPVHLEEGDTHDVDDEGGDEGEDAFPDLFGIRPEIGEFGVELEVSIDCIQE